MSMLDPFNPRPGQSPGDEFEQRHPGPPGGGGKSFLWVPAVIVGGIGVLVVVASL